MVLINIMFDFANEKSFSTNCFHRNLNPTTSITTFMSESLSGHADNPTGGKDIFFCGTNGYSSVFAKVVHFNLCQMNPVHKPIFAFYKSQCKLTLGCDIEGTMTSWVAMQLG